MSRREIAVRLVAAAMVLAFLLIYGTILGMVLCVPAHP